MKNIFKVKAIYRIAWVIALVAVMGFSFVACSDGSTDDPPPSTLTITNFGGKLPEGKFLFGYDDDGDMFFAINADEHAVLITGTTLTLKVYDNYILFTGTKTLGTGKLYLEQVSDFDFPRGIEKTFTNTVDIEFINGSATINMSTQMDNGT